MARALRRACRDRGLPVTGHAALRTTPLALRRLGQGSPAACGECGGPQRRAPECLAARQTASHHAALTPRPPDGRLTPTRRLRQRYQFVTLRCCRGIWWRRSWLSLKGMIGIHGQDRAKGGALLRHSALQHQPTDPCTTLTIGATEPTKNCPYEVDQFTSKKILAGPSPPAPARIAPARDDDEASCERW